MTKVLAAAIAIMAVIPSAAGEAFICTRAVEGVARNPEATGKLRSTMILGCALTETTALYALIVSILCLFAA